MSLALPSLDFRLPPDREAHEPPEARGLARDGVRLLVSQLATDRVWHAHFSDLPTFLRPGDLLVVNTSGTLPAALDARRAAGPAIRLHLSSQLPGDLWSVELRALEDGTTRPLLSAQAGEVVTLPEGGQARLLAPASAQAQLGGVRLWLARLELPEALLPYLLRHGQPIRYAYVPEPWPLDAYQTVYATEPGSAEMPSAGRAFTPALFTRLMAAGVKLAPLLLHTGVASPEAHEPPSQEFYRVPEATARHVNAVRASGGRVIAVGTTVVRALETVTDGRGTVHPGEGHTALVVTPQRGLRAVDGLLTGWHEPRASHLLMLEALAGPRHLELAYRAALDGGYLWHEFGDLHLMLP